MAFLMHNWLTFSGSSASLYIITLRLLVEVDTSLSPTLLIVLSSITHLQYSLVKWLWINKDKQGCLDQQAEGSTLHIDAALRK